MIMMQLLNLEKINSISSTQKSNNNNVIKWNQSDILISHCCFKYLQAHPVEANVKPDVSPDFWTLPISLY